MPLFLRLLLLPLLFASAAFAAPSEARRAEAEALLRDYTAALSAGDAARVAATFHPDYQAKLKDNVVRMLGQMPNSPASRRQLNNLRVRSLDAFLALPTADAAERVLQVVYDAMPIDSRRAAATSRLRFVGLLQENANYFAVARLTISFGAGVVDKPQVLLLREHEGRLRIVTTAESGQGLASPAPATAAPAR